MKESHNPLYVILWFSFTCVTCAHTVVTSSMPRTSVRTYIPLHRSQGCSLGFSGFRVIADYGNLRLNTRSALGFEAIGEARHEGCIIAVL